MSTLTLIIIIVLVLAIVGIGVWFLLRERRSRGLRDRFGPEYERSIAATEDRRAAESDLREREKRHRDLDIRPLSAEDRSGFETRWAAVQQGFVDDPGQAVRGADTLVDDVMHARGYPVDDFEQRAADVSVEHPIVVQRYREARGIAEAHDAGQASTEDLRQAVTSYRALVVALLEPDTTVVDEDTTVVDEDTTVVDPDTTVVDEDATVVDEDADRQPREIPEQDTPATDTARETRA